MKNSRFFKKGIILLSLIFLVGAFSAIALADNNKMNGESKGTINTPRYGMQNNNSLSQEQNLNCEDCTENLNNGMNTGMGNSENVPDDDNDGIPNGQDSDYAQHDCDEECDGSCDSEPKGSGRRRNYSENGETVEALAHLNGRELKEIKILDLAKLWGMDAELLLSELVGEFNLTEKYTVDNIIEDLRGEFRFSPFQINDLAEKIKMS